MGSSDDKQKQEMQDLWEQLPPLYDRATKSFGPIWNEMLKAVEKELSEEPKAILDLASGPGEPGLTLAKRFPSAKVILSDLAQGMIDKAAARTEAQGLKGQVELMLLDIQDMQKIPSDSQDVVTCSLGLFAVPDKAKAFSEIARVLKPKGLLVASVWQKTPHMDYAARAMELFTKKPAPEMPIDPNCLAYGKADEFMAKAGLEKTESSDLDLPITLDVGLPEAEDTWKLGMIAHLVKILNMEKEGEIENATAKAKEAFIEVSKDTLNSSGSVTFTLEYRLLVVRKAS